MLHSTYFIRSKHSEERRFGLLRVRSPLLTEYLLVSTPPGTEMFYFPGYARAPRKTSVQNNEVRSMNYE